MAVSEAKAERVKEVYEETGDIGDTSMRTSTPKEDVAEIVGEEVPEEEEEIDEWDVEEDSGAEEGTEETSPFAPPPGASQDEDAVVSPDGDTVPDFSKLSPGKFIRWFFQTYDVPAKDEFVNVIATHSDVYESIPDKDLFKRRLKEANSGIGDDETIQMIGDIYGEAAQKWKQENTRPSPQPTESNYGNGSWMDVSRGGDGRQGGESKEEGGWMSPDTGGRPNTSPGQMGTGNGGQGQQSGQMQMFQMMMEQMERQQQQFQQAIREIKQTQQQDQRGGQSDIIEEMQKISELQKAAEELGDSGGGEAEELARAVAQDLQEVKSEIAKQGQEPGQGSVDPMERAMLTLAGKEDVDVATLSEFANAMGGNEDPEVKKTKIETEADLRKSEHRKEMVENFTSNIGEGAGEALGALVRTFSQAQNEQRQRQQPRQQQQPAGQARQPQQQQAQQHGQGVERQQPAPEEPEPQGVEMRKESEDTLVETEPGDVEKANTGSSTKESVMSRIEDDVSDLEESEGKEQRTTGGGGITAGEAEERYDSSAYQSFISECSAENDYEHCVDLWNEMKEASGE